MKMIDDNDNINYLEQKMTLITDLLEIAKTYCEHSYDKSECVAALGSILEIILKNQQEMTAKFDSMLTC